MNQTLLSIFIQEMHKYELLTIAQEQHLLKLIFNRKHLVDAAIDGLSNYDRARRQTLLTALKKIVCHNLRLAFSVAKRMVKTPYPSFGLLDAINEGAIALRHAALKFEPDRGYKFSTYAVHWLRSYIGRAIDDNKNTVRVPQHVSEKQNMINRSIESIQHAGFALTIDRIARQTDLDPETVRTTMQSNLPCYSIDFAYDEGCQLGDTLGVSDDRFDVESFRSILASTMVRVKPRDRDIFYFRHGLIDGEKWSHAAIAKQFKLSREQVRKINAQVLRIVRGHSDKFNCFVN